MRVAIICNSGQSMLDSLSYSNIDRKRKHQGIRAEIADFVYPWTYNCKDVHYRFLNLDWNFSPSTKSDTAKDEENIDTGNDRMKSPLWCWWSCTSDCYTWSPITDTTTYHCLVIPWSVGKSNYDWRYKYSVTSESAPSLSGCMKHAHLWYT